MDRFLLTSHFCSSLLSLCPTQGHPIKGFSTHLGTYLTIWIKERFKQGPHSTCIFIPLRAPISTARTSFCLSSTLIINPLQNLLLTITYRLPQCSHQPNGNQVQQLQISTSSTYHLLETESRKKKKLASTFFEFSFLSHLAPSYSPYLHSMSQFPKPFIACC